MFDNDITDLGNKILNNIKFLYKHNQILEDAYTLLPMDIELINNRATTFYESEHIPSFENVCHSIFSIYVKNDLASTIGFDVKDFLKNFLVSLKRSDLVTESLVREIPYSTLLIYIYCKNIVSDHELIDLNNLLKLIKENQVDGVLTRNSTNSIYGITVK